MSTTVPFYNLIFRKPVGRHVIMVCDSVSCWVRGCDSVKEAISKRLDTYNEKTAPLANFYRKEGMLMDVNATSSDTVVSAIRARVGV
mgnify:CR=1 FL=1